MCSRRGIKWHTKRGIVYLYFNSASRRNVCRISALFAIVVAAEGIRRVTTSPSTTPVTIMAVVLEPSASVLRQSHMLVLLSVFAKVYLMPPAAAKQLVQSYSAAPFSGVYKFVPVYKLPRLVNVVVLLLEML